MKKGFGENHRRRELIKWMPRPGWKAVTIWIKRDLRRDKTEKSLRLKGEFKTKNWGSRGFMLISWGGDSKIGGKIGQEDEFEILTLRRRKKQRKTAGRIRAT